MEGALKLERGLKIFNPPLTSEKGLNWREASIRRGLKLEEIGIRGKPMTLCMETK